MTLQFVSNDEFDTGGVTRWGGLGTDNRFFSMYIYISQVHKLLPKVMKLNPARGGLPDQWVSFFLLFSNRWKNSFSFFFFFIIFLSFLSLFVSWVDALNIRYQRNEAMKLLEGTFFTFKRLYIRVCVCVCVYVLVRCYVEMLLTGEEESDQGM